MIRSIFIVLNRLVVKTVRENETFDHSKGAEVKCTLYILIKDAKATNTGIEMSR